MLQLYGPGGSRDARAVPVVLIVEDEPAARELIAGYLNPLGIATEFVPNASAAAAVAKELRPDAIMLDLLMPGRSGWRVLGGTALRAGNAGTRRFSSCPCWTAMRKRSAWAPPTICRSR